MRGVRGFLQILEAQPSLHLMVEAPGSLGLELLLEKALKKIAASEDVQIYDCGSLSLDRLRDVLRGAQMAPRAGSSHNHLCFLNLQRLAPICVGPLLKSMEETIYSRFIFFSILG